MAGGNKLTIVIGAGASREFGLPMGSELKSAISSLLNITFDHWDQKSGDHLITEALRIDAKNRFNDRSINPYLRKLHHIRDAMPQAPSIDNFIDTHQGDKEIEICGKLAISRAILSAERQSKLYVDPNNYKNKLKFDRTEDTWLNPLLRIVTENCRAADLAQRLSGLKFIVFNYDRCLEHYLCSWIQSYYGIPDTEASSLVRAIEIFHPYGTVGSLPWQSRPTVSIGFGAEPHHTELLSIAEQIKTFTEGTDPSSSDITRIREIVQTADILMFLGFGYHKLNLQLLGSPFSRTDKVRHIFATASGISEHNCGTIRSELASFTSVPIDNIQLRNDLLCTALVHEYSRSLYLH